jgi:adenylate kinase
VLADRLGALLLSTGEVLRAQVDAGTELGHVVTPYLAKGALVPDDLVLEVVADRLARSDAEGGYVLDGFPRTVFQAERLDTTATPPDAVVHLRLDDTIARLRMAQRGEGRVDDGNLAVVDERLRVYHDQTSPLLDYYGAQSLLLTVDAAEAPDLVTGAIIQALDASVAT